MEYSLELMPKKVTNESLTSILMILQELSPLW